MTMKFWSLAFCVVLICSGAGAQSAAWQPGAGHEQVPIWPEAAPDARPAKGAERAVKEGGTVAGRPVTTVHYVSRPTMTVYSPKEKNTGAALVVFPGGGFSVLAIDLEGSEVCEWMAARGITCVLLKYRVPDSGPYSDAGKQRYPAAPLALEDAQRTVRLVRFHAGEYHIDPHKIGVLGFSAGGYLAADISTNYEKRTYAEKSEADRVSCRPDFAVVMYPGHLQASHDGVTLNSRIAVTRQTPPTFLLQNEDDHVDSINDALVYYIALKNAGVPVEFHSYTQGGHGFGLRRTQLAVTGWPELVETWLRGLGMIER